MSPARCAVSSLIWQNPESTRHHPPQRHRRLPIASILVKEVLSAFDFFMRFRALAGVLIALIAIEMIMM
jgi:hypothetical protein